MPSVSHMGVPGFNQKPFQPKLAHHYRITFVGWGRLVSGINAENLSVQVSSFTPPNITFETAESHRYNSTVTVTGRAKLGQASIVLEDDIGGLVTAAVNAQVNTQQLISGTGLKADYLPSAPTGSDYKFSMIVDLLDGGTGVVESTVYESCAIIDASREQLNSDSGATKLMHTLSVSVDAMHNIQSGSGYGLATAQLG